VILATAAAVFLGAPAAWPGLAQGAAQKPAEKSPEKVLEKAKEKPATKAPPRLPAEIELLETRIRFEADGGSRKEVHARVKINDELGVRQFARLSFDFNRSFQNVEIPLVRITHPSGGIADVLPSAITDTPNPAVVNAPAYQDVRVKSVRILGLEPGDTLEYRVITTTSHSPLAPDFWLDHTFDRNGVVSHEIFELDVPLPRLRIHINEKTPATKKEKSGEGEFARGFYRWELESKQAASTSPDSSRPDVEVTTFASWASLSERVQQVVSPGFSTQLWSDAMTSIGAPHEPVPPSVLYKFVSQKIATVDVSLDTSSGVHRDASQILKSGYGTTLEKATLLQDLIIQNSDARHIKLIMYGRGVSLEEQLPRPTLLSGALLVLHEKAQTFFLDSDLGVAPFGLVPANLRGKKALIIGGLSRDADDSFTEIPESLPFRASQKVAISSLLSSAGELKAKVKYVMRGDNELVLRLAFHQTPKENWKNVAQLLALSDGFRGQITNVNAADPYETHDPFTVEYEITQPKFVDWSKKPVRIPALLPLLGLPDPPAKPAPGGATSPIDLGTPLDVQVSATVHLPPGTTARIPTGTSVERDFATYTSQYSAQDATLTASRHLNFILKEIPGDRTADYETFLRTVQNDESQFFQLELAEATATKPQKP
jgi:hypothetical protein